MVKAENSMHSTCKVEKFEGQIKVRLCVCGSCEAIYPQSDSPTGSSDSLKLEEKLVEVTSFA